MLDLTPFQIPLRLEEDGSYRVGRSRVLLDLVVQAFQQGQTPEQILHSYDSLVLEDIYAVLAFYLRHHQAVDVYLAQREQAAEAWWAEHEATPRHKALRTRLATLTLPIHEVLS